VCAAWAAAEASVFFVVPDVPVGLLALRDPRRAPRAWAAAALGGVVGALVLRAAIRDGWDPEPPFRRLPGIRPDDIGQAELAVVKDPVAAFGSGAFGGTPLKLYVAAATRRGVSDERLVGLIVLNRVPRLGLVAGVSTLVGAAARAAGIPPAVQVAGYLGAWTAFYAWYWASRSGNPGTCPRVTVT
jgi:hypothetical protein